MAGVSLNKKKGTKAQKAPPKKKQKNELFTAKKSKKEEISDHSDVSDEEEVKELEEIDGDEDGSDSVSLSDVSSDGDNPFTDDFLQGSDNEGILNIFVAEVLFCCYFFFLTLCYCR